MFGNLGKNALEAVVVDQIKKVNPKEIITFLEGAFTSEIAALKAADTNGDGASDLADVEKDIATMAAAGADVFSKLQALHAKK